MAQSKICKNCNAELQSVVFGIGKNVSLRAKHCPECFFNYANELKLKKFLWLIKYY